MPIRFNFALSCALLNNHILIIREKADYQEKQGGGKAMVEQNKMYQWINDVNARVSKKSWGTYIEFTESELKNLIDLAIEHGAKQANASQDTQTLVTASTKLADDMHELIGNSEGVAGLHQNGDVADWDSLMAGGQHEGWLSSLDEMDQILANRLLHKLDSNQSATAPAPTSTGSPAPEQNQEYQNKTATLTELQKDASNLLFALHDSWPYVHQWCTIQSKRARIQNLIQKHGEFSDLRQPSSNDFAQKTVDEQNEPGPSA